MERKTSGGLFYGSWGFTREAFFSVGGYPAMQSGQDQALAGRFKRAAIRAASPEGLSSYIYRWHTYPNARHISAMGKDGYERRGQEAIEPVTQLSPARSREWCVMVPG